MCILTALTSIALASMSAQGQDSIPERSITAPISQVSVFPSGARIVHSGKVELAKGQTRIYVTLIDKVTDEELENLQNLTAIATGADIREIGVTKSNRAASPEKLTDLEKKIVTSREALQTARIRTTNSRSDAQLLDLFASRMAEGATSLDRTQLVDLLDFLSERRRALAEDIMRQSSAATEHEKNLEKLMLEQKHLKKGIPVATAELLVDSEGGEAAITLTWLDGESSWKPVYSIQRDQKSDIANVVVDANVINDSMVDWTDVQIELSNAYVEPINMLAPVTPVSVDIAPDDSQYQPNDAYSSESRAMVFGSEISVTDTITVYKLKAPTTIDSRSSRQVQIDRFDSPTSMQAIARPTVDSEVFSQATLKNAPNLLLLPGFSYLYIDGIYVGETVLKNTVAPGAEFYIPYGPMPKVTVKRTVVERETVSTGLLGGGRRTRTSYRVEIHNDRTTPVDLILEDRVTVSRTDEIEVSLKNLSLPLSTDPNYLATERPLGILRWNIQLPAGGPSAPPLVVEWTVDVSRSADLDTTAIPE